MTIVVTFTMVQCSMVPGSLSSQLEILYTGNLKLTSTHATISQKAQTTAVSCQTDSVCALRTCVQGLSTAAVHAACSAVQ